MNMNFKKLYILTGALCSILFSSAFAQSNAPSTGQKTYQHDTPKEITPTAGPCISNGAGVFVTANFIWWKATQDTLNYAMSGVTSVSSIGQGLVSATGITGQGRVSDPGFGWEPGFKVGLGANLRHDGWDLYAQYTWLHSSSSSTSTGIGITNAVPSVIAGLGGIQPLGDVRRSADWHLHFNVIDLELGRNFYVSPRLMLRPHFGLKGTWQDQDLTVTTSASGQFDSLGLGPYRAKIDHDTWGLGVRAGLNTAWHFTTNWSIFGNAAWAAMWTHYDVDRLDRFTVSTDPAATFTFVNTEMNNYRVKYVGELELGLRWEIWFYSDRFHFAVQAGWEEQVWINYGHYIRLYNDVQGDLTLHGLNLKFRFDF